MLSEALTDEQTLLYLYSTPPHPSPPAARRHSWCLLWTEGLCKLPTNTHVMHKVATADWFGRKLVLIIHNGECLSKTTWGLTYRAPFAVVKVTKFK